MQVFNEDNNSSFFGMYRALVVNNGIDSTFKDYAADSEKRGRVQVRVLGIHSSNNKTDSPDGIANSELPWAEPAGSLLGGFVEGSKGKSGIFTIPDNGAWVWVFFDNGDHQKPVYFASIPGNNDIADKDAKGITTIRTKSGNTITMDDTSDLESIVIKNANGETQIKVSKDLVVVYGKKVQVTATEELTLGDNPSGYLLTSQTTAKIQAGNVFLTPRAKIRA